MNVRSELEPWDKQLLEHKGKLDVASTESNLLNEKVSLEAQFGLAKILNVLLSGLYQLQGHFLLFLPSR